MKALFILLIIACIFIGKPLYSQTPSTCTPSAFLSFVYDNDVKDLALQRMYAIAAADTALINIPEIYQDTILDGMAAIYNLDTALHTDSVFKLYCIHRFPYGFIKTSLSVKVDTSYAWALQWDSLRTITGYGALDSFMSRYGFTLQNFYNLGGFYDNLAIITTTKAINTTAFADSLALFPGVVYTYFNPEVGDHSGITYQMDSVRTYSFRLGWGDCPSGCTSAEIWTYKVDNFCNVTLLYESRGGLDPFPSPLNCYAKLSIPQATKTLSINTYPNPVSDVLHISLQGEKNPCFYNLADMYGRIVSSGGAENNTSVNVSRLAAGLYVLQVKNNEGAVYYKKIVKE